MIMFQVHATALILYVLVHSHDQISPPPDQTNIRRPLSAIHLDADWVKNGERQEDVRVSSAPTTPQFQKHTSTYCGIVVLFQEHWPRTGAPRRQPDNICAWSR